MYGTPNSSTYEAEHLSTKTSTSSTIKTVIDAWYRDNMTSYTSYLEDAIWCNDRSFSSSNTGTGAGTSKTEYYDENADKTSGGSCIDDDGRTVCKVYEIKVANTGSTPVSLFGTLTLEADTDSDGTSKMTNLKWGLGTDATTGFGTVYGVDKTSLVNPATDTEGNYTSVYLEAKDDASTADEKTFYVVVFLDDPNRAQDTEDIGYFKGTVSFFAGDGSTGLTSTFTDYTE